MDPEKVRRLVKRIEEQQNNTRDILRQKAMALKIYHDELLSAGFDKHMALTLLLVFEQKIS